ncbi:MAG: outer membrane beta-barrel protein, partial [Elusimicrobia bacterium]|nr:outer membrane beta-barrel protein [Elusimicrobiota bacterium]
VDLQQAFFSLPVSWVGGALTVGKFVTLHGAEVIEAKDNFNVSRGLLFNYAIPFSHTGVKWDKGWNEKLASSIGVVNGWDNLQDNTKGKSVHGMASYAFSPALALTVGGTYGPEQTTAVPSVEKNARGLVDTLVKIVPAEDLTLLLNHDWGVEEGLGAAGPSDTTQNWHGLGVHANYAFTDAFSTALRWETLDDEGSRTGTQQVLNSATATLQQIFSGVITRLEFRRDGSSQKVFVDDNGAPDDAQNTVGFQVIYPF